ncbi:MAG TPA: glycosyltransferase family 2 protein [Solirubrobacteraceae bacterium]|jgi:glycosyltransferase involved in cell wall biosynthesis|nr:glycosyltransferase family 2 protein [Solirubrobacteraceae bacterium]
MPDAGAGVSDQITVVIPTQNRAELLAQTLRSVREQSLAPTAVIVADDGSTDATEQVAHAAGARHIRNERGDWGPAGARNAGMRAAATEYVSFIDSDDLLHPCALERLHGALGARPDALFCFGCALAARRTNAGWRSEGLLGPRPWELEDFLCSLYARNSIPSGATLVRRRAALEQGGFDERLRLAEDHAFWLQLARLAPPAHIPAVIYVHRRHAGNSMSATTAVAYEPLLADMASNDPRLARCVPRRRGVQLCELAIDAAHRHSGAGLRAAIDCLLPEGDRVAVVRAAFTHWRTRREGASDGAALLAHDRQLRDWLATY